MTKTILITGATDGIGLLTAKNLAAEGHQVLIHGRSAEKLAAAANEIAGDVKGYLADLADLAQVENLAAEIHANHKRIDVLINNAGVLKTKPTQTATQHDVRFVVNTFAPFMLAKALLPLIPAQGRIINLSSAAQAPVNLDALHGKLVLNDMGAYSQSKLAITIWSREWAKTLPDGPVVVAVNPGSLLASKMVKEGFGIAGNDLQIGADILYRAALHGSFETASGKYYDNDSSVFADPHPAALDPKHCQDVMTGIEAAIDDILSA